MPRPKKQRYPIPERIDEDTLHLIGRDIVDWVLMFEYDADINGGDMVEHVLGVIDFRQRPRETWPERFKTDI